MISPVIIEPFADGPFHYAAVNEIQFGLYAQRRPRLFVVSVKKPGKPFTHFETRSLKRAAEEFARLFLEAKGQALAEASKNKAHTI